jgi:hypothetical protein
MDQIWEKLGERIGPENVERIRGAIDRLTGIWNFIRDVQERGVAAIWEYIESQISNLWDMLLEKARDWIVTEIIERVVTRLISMLDPTGIMAVVNSFMAFFNAVQSAIEYFREILMIVDDYVSTIASVAQGDVEPGAEKMEQGLASSIPVAIGFLAKQVGLDNLSEKIVEIIGGIRELVDRALDWLLDRAVSMGQSILNSLGLGGEENADEESENEGTDNPEIQQGINAIRTEENARASGDGSISPEDAQAIAQTVQVQHTVFASITPVEANNSWDYEYVLQASKIDGSKPKELTDAEVHQELRQISGQFGNLQCQQCANALENWLKEQGIAGKYLTIKGGGDFIVSDRYGGETAISQNGYHYGVETRGLVFDNVPNTGLPRGSWLGDFDSIGGIQLESEREF